MNRKLSLILLTAAFSLASIAKGSELPNDVSAQRQKIVKQLEEARGEGVGIKPYENALSSIDTDAAQGLPSEKIKKRLDSLGDSLTRQLNEITALRLGASSGNVSSAQARDWGQYAPYMLAAQTKIKRHWHPPLERSSHHMAVLFKIAKDGQVSDLKMAQSSGIEELDRSILRAVEEASPRPPLPSFCKDKAVNIEFTFDYNFWKSRRFGAY